MKQIVFVLAVIFFLNLNLHAEQSVEPTIDEVQKAALDYARLSPDELSSFKKRTKRAAALPRLMVGAKRDARNNVDVAVNDNVSVTTSGVNIGPQTNDVTQLSDNTMSIEVKAVWNLNELVYNRDMLDVAEEARYQMRERRLLLSEVNKLYFDRKKVVDEIGESKKDPSKKGETRALQYKLDELCAGLDALTGGWFSGRIGKI